MGRDYQFDIFLSYRRSPPVGDWVTNHFLPLLEKWLPQCTPYKPEIFVDRSIETGSRWSPKICNALKSSRCMVAIWSTDYFRSPWCVAEWQSMKMREKMLGFTADENPLGLIYAIRFADGDLFPQEAKDTQQRDLGAWAISSPIFAQTRGFVEFEIEMKLVSQEIWSMLKSVPKWQSDWPAVTPQSDEERAIEENIKIPRI